MLDPLFDIDGVYGSFVLDDQGLLLGARLPATMQSAALQAAGIRITRLWAALPEGGELVLQVLRFNGHSLFVNRWARGSLCILGRSAVDVPALKVVTALVACNLEDCVRTREQATRHSQRKHSLIYRGVHYDE